MAKPLQVQLATQSKASLFNHQDPSSSSHRPRQRGRRASRQSSQKAGPSSSLLTLLASLASASTAYGSPAPPSFLCPTLDSEDVADCPLTNRPSTSQTPVVKVFAEATNTLLPRHVPDRYSKEPDGVWRRIDSYTLYGSTVPVSTSYSPTPTAIISPLDDQIQVGDTATASSTTSSFYDISTDLPPGWKPVQRENRTALILLISLFLALFIGSFIVGCMLWRKRKIKKASRDIEAKGHRKRDRNSEAEEAQVILEKEIKTKQKLWAKATARWRTNARHSARQRRGRRISSRLPQANQSSTSLDNSRGYLARSSSAPPSRSSSRRSSTASLDDQFHHESISIPSPPSQDDHSRTALATPESSTRVSPPAYQHSGEIPRIMVSTGDSSSVNYSGLSTPVGTGRSRRPSHSSALTSLTDASQNNTPTSLCAAHVATDDKALLARLAMLASAPPEDEFDANTGSALQISVPEWEDEPLEDIAPHLVNSSASNAFSPMFPLPPSKERLAAAEFYDYPYAFEDMALSDLQAGPSAPPFEEASSPQQDLVPSAPPLFEDDALAAGAQPSAPSWDSSSQSENEYQHMYVSEPDGDRVQSVSTTSSSTDRSPSLGRSPVRDSVVLPRYQP